MYFSENDGDVWNWRTDVPIGISRYPGKVVGDAIKCDTMEWRSARGGRCILVPSQKAVPPLLACEPIQRLSATVGFGCGRGSSESGCNRIPDFWPSHGQPNAAVGTTNHVRASYQLVVDNLRNLLMWVFPIRRPSAIHNGSNGRLK